MVENEALTPAEAGDAKPKKKKSKAIVPRKTEKKTKKTKKKARKVVKKAVSKPIRRLANSALVIVESPAKAKTIKKYLGPGFVVKASVGHVKDLPKSSMSVDIEHDFAPRYETIRGKSKVLKEIKDAAKLADIIYLAPDPDREGEAIAWHIAQELGKQNQERMHRISFNEITEQAVRQAIEHPEPLNEQLFFSQQARRILDRIVGYQISPILWEKVRRGLSAGRVQSVAVRLIVEREQEIKVFRPDEYWSLECAMQTTANERFAAKVTHLGDDKFRPTNRQDAESAAQILKEGSPITKSVVRRERRRRPVAPLITSKLQQEGAGRLHFTAKRTMMIAQQLYEGVELGEEGQVALITYMRTDSTRVSDGALADVRTYIEKTYGRDYLPAEANLYKTKKKNVQDAHEAIRPTSLAYPPERVAPFLSLEQLKLYRLIWNCFVASQMSAAVYDQTTIDIAVATLTLRASGSITKFPGFLAVYEELVASPQQASSENDATAKLPELSEGQPLKQTDVEAKQHFTQPPPKFTESSLVRELEEKGIGRPSTYAAILSTIVTRNYVVKEEGRFTPSELGTLITGLLCESFPRVLDVQFTAEMEDKLDRVETGEVNWVELLKEFYEGGFRASLERAKVEMRDVKREEIPTEHACPDCGQTLMLKWGRNGSFLACQGYPECRNTRDYKRRPDDSIEILPEPKTDERCPVCDKEMSVKRGRFGQFYACGTYPECKGTRPVSIGVDCPNGCGNYLAERRSKRGRSFYGCAGYPACTFAAWDRPVPGPCPTCAGSYLIRKYSKKDGVSIRCPNKECAYQRDPELDDADARAVAEV